MSECSGPSDDARLIEFLRGRDVACPVCGYNLRGIQDSRCPECAEQLTIGVHRADLDLYSWYIGLIPLSGGLFWSVLSLILRVTVLLDEFAWAYLGVTVAFGISAFGWVRWRREFQHLQPGVRGFLAGGTWVLSLIAGLTLMYVSRP